MYWTISVAISAFAAYGNMELLWLQFLLLPLVMKGKRDFPAIALLLIVSFLSYYHFSTYIISHTPTKIEIPHNKALQWTATVKVDGAKVKGFAKEPNGILYYLIYTIKTEEEKHMLESMDLVGRSVIVHGVLELPESPAHKYAFNMAHYLRMNGATRLFRATKMNVKNQVDSPFTRLSKRRALVKDHIAEVFPVSLQVEAEALLIGDRSNMDAATSSQYRTLGITHLFAISGLHVGLLTIMLRISAKRLRIRIETVDTLLLFALPCYALLAGGAPSVWRAVTVTVLILLTSTGRLKLRAEDALALSAIGFMLLKPYVLFQPGFQLSYAAAFSLLYSATYLSRHLNVLIVSAKVTAITQLALAPILLFHFYELSLSSFIVNIIYVPLYSIVILPSNIVLLIVSLISKKVAIPLFFIYKPIRNGVTIATTWLADLPYQVWTAGKPSLLLMAMMVVCVACCFLIIERSNRYFIGLLIIVTPALIIQTKPYFDPITYVSFLDVGQGDSIVVELPYKKGVYVIDTGGNVFFDDSTWKTPEKPFEIGRQIVVPYLKGRGISSIDKLIISHAHSDHMEGADEVLQEIRVKEVHTPAGSLQEETMSNVMEETRRQRIAVLSKLTGDGWFAGDTEFAYLSPFDENYTHNNSSLVLLMKNEFGYLLFTGDLEKEGEQKIIRKFGHVELKPLILKVGHHGSHTSTTEELLDFLDPELAVISAGRNNRYGHPHADVVERLTTKEVTTYSTADHGTVVLELKGKQLDVLFSRQKKKDSD